MRQSSVAMMVLAMALSVSAALILQSPVSAQGVPPSGQGTKPSTPPPSPSIKGTVGQLKTDTGKTTDDVMGFEGRAQQMPAIDPIIDDQNFGLHARPRLEIAPYSQRTDNMVLLGSPVTARTA